MLYYEDSVMRYFATYNTVTTSDMSGDPDWIEISEQQYNDGVDALMSGREIIVEDGFLIRDQAPSPEHVWQNGQWVLPPPPEPEPPTKQELLGYAALKRYEKEVGGTLWNGWPVHTDRESQSKIIAERLAIEAGERNDPDGWKFADGQFRLVSNEDFMALTSAVRQHVRDCFALEAVVLAQIEAGTVTEYSQIDAAFDQEATYG